MAFDPKAKDMLTRFTMVAKGFLYNADHMREIIGMLGTKDGAVMAVHAVLSAIEKQKPIPPEIYSFLGINIYMVMVDSAREASKTKKNPKGIKPDPEIMNAVIKQILNETKPRQQVDQQTPQQPQQQGIIASQMQGVPA